ncbi:unnamed protein product [Blepharisma stoltei]|uniref:N-acetyltransferase domain-containing protein n=1 Tax=Blepharisma stoltei TaxID=1481888 RepID=A0AAU9JQI7_9CILI|nr:unnamed protein product [Blepharisma stoltei]
MSTCDLTWCVNTGSWEELLAALQLPENRAEIAKFASGASYLHQPTGVEYTLMRQDDREKVFQLIANILATQEPMSTIGITVEEYIRYILGLFASTTYLPYTIVFKSGNEIVGAYLTNDHHTRQLPALDQMSQDQLAFFQKAAPHIEIGTRAACVDPSPEASGRVINGYSDAIREDFRGKGIGRYGNAIRMALAYHLGFNLIFRICDNESSVMSGRRYFENGHMVLYESIEIGGVKPYQGLKGGKVCQFRHLNPRL